VKKGLFEELSDLIVSGRRFTEADIASFKSSAAYQDCSSAERSFIDQLFADYTEPPKKQK
jgi:hypothetical protein